MIVPIVVKCSVSPADWKPVPIDIVAPVTSVSNDETVTAESTVTVWPAVELMLDWTAVTTGASMATLTVSPPVLLVCGEAELSLAATSIVLVAVLWLLVEKLTESQGRRVLGSAWPNRSG